MRTTTLNKIKKHSPCGDGWEKLLKFLGKAEADDEPLSYLTILESNGLDDCLWAARADDSEDADKFWRLLACDFAEHMNPTDPSSINAIAVARKFANGDATSKELAAARGAAWEAARAVWDEARAARAAWTAAWEVTRTAAWEAAWKAARAAWTAWIAWEAAWEAGAAERDWQTAHLRATLEAL